MSVQHSAPTLEQIAEALGGRISNGTLRAPCPAHGGTDPNLAITYEGDKLLARCHSHECDFEDIVAAIRERLGEEPSEATEERHPVTFGHRKSRARNGDQRQTWELRDATGSLVAYHVREDRGPNGDKVVRWKMPDGRWKLDRPTAELPLYGAENAARAAAGVSIVVTEGEKAADALRAVCASHRAPLEVVGTVTGASGTPGPEALEVLRGRRVVLWPDNDGPGFEHMGRIAEALVGMAAEICWYEWEEAPEKGDAADHPGTRGAEAFVRSGLLLELLEAERWSKPPAIEGRMLVGQAIENGVEPPEELLPNILLAAKAHNVYAPGGVGKTWVLVWLAAQLVKRGKKVVVFDLENGLRTYAERFEEIGVEPGRLDELLHYYPFPMLSREVYEKMLDEERPDIVMFDSWIGFLAADGRDENVSNDISAWADAFSKPALRRGVSICVLDHVPHEHERERGSTRKRDEMDVVWKLSKMLDFDRDRIGQLSMTLQKDREGWLPFKIGFEIGGDPDTGSFVMRRDDALAREAVNFVTADEQRALDLLGEGLRAVEWQRRAKGQRISRATFYRLLAGLKEKGKVVLDGEIYRKYDGTIEGSVSEVSSGLKQSHETDETTGAGAWSQRSHPLKGVVRPAETGAPHGGPPSGAESETAGETASETTGETDEPQDLGAKLRRIRDEMRRGRDA